MLANTDDALYRISNITLNDDHIIRRTLVIEQEKSTAIRDLLRANYFKLSQIDRDGPYAISMRICDQNILIQINGEAGAPFETLSISMRPFKKLIKDYFLICDGFHEASRLGERAKLETLDMARRGLHNEGASQLKDYLQNKADMDMQTARRFFTLICVLHI